jgi:glycosyltransferase involved in cell wall biosynthesis
MEMPLRNIEGHSEFNIAPDWHEHRLKGISAYIRTKGEERWIGPTIESILDFFDEIVVTLDNIDRTKEILKEFRSPKIKIFDYPFELKPFGHGYDNCPMNSVHSFAHYTNWSVSKTIYSHVCRWDGDMIMLPSFKKNRDLILRKNIVRFKGYDVVTPDFKYMSKHHPFAGPEPRIHKIDKHIFYYQMPLMEGLNYQGLKQLFYLNRWKEFPNLQMQRIVNFFVRTDIKMQEPAFLHMKFLKDWKNKYAKNEKADWDAPFYKELSSMGDRGDEICTDIPECTYKLPEDYL